MIYDFIVDAIATIVYGALTLLLTFAVSLWAGSFWGMALTAGAAGCTYVFQALQTIDAPDWLLNLTWLLVISLVVGSWVTVACA